MDAELLAGSDGAFLQFDGYLEGFDQLFLRWYWMFEDSDVGTEYVVTFDRDLKVKEFFPDSFTGGGGCDCEVEPSEDGQTIALCSRILRANGKHTELGKNEEEVVGSFVVNNDYCLVIYNYDGKPPYKNARILNKRGVVEKTFDFTGITEALGYVIPIVRYDKRGEIILLDQYKRCLFRIQTAQPKKVEVIDIDAIEKVQEGKAISEDDPSYFAISSETKTFYFTYQNGIFKYYNESEGDY